MEITREDVIAGHILPLKENIVELIKLEEDIKKSLSEKETYLEYFETNKIAPLVVRMNNILGQIAIHNSTVDSLNIEIESRKKELESLQDSHKMEHEIHSQKILTLRQTISDSSKKVDVDTTSLEEISTRKSVLNDEIVSLMQQKKNLLEETHDLSITLLKTNGELTRISNEIVKSDKVLKKLLSDIKRLTERRDVVVEDVLTEKNVKLFERYNIQIKKSQALDSQILVKRNSLKK